MFLFFVSSLSLSLSLSRSLSVFPDFLTIFGLSIKTVTCSNFFEVRITFSDQSWEKWPSSMLEVTHRMLSTTHSLKKVQITWNFCTLSICPRKCKRQVSEGSILWHLGVWRGLQLPHLHEDRCSHTFLIPQAVYTKINSQLQVRGGYGPKSKTPTSI